MTGMYKHEAVLLGISPQVMSSPSPLMWLVVNIGHIVFGIAAN
jgi:urea transporter